MAQAPSEADTKHRILSAALGLFSRDGYHGASVSSICSAAGVNVAAVNYHFGSKLGLYIEVWKSALEDDVASAPFHEEPSDGLTDEERLRGRVRWLVNRFVRPGGPSDLAMLIIHELADPTDPLVDAVRMRAVGPVHDSMRELVGRMLGEGATEREVLFATEGVFLPVFGLGLQQQSVYRGDKWATEAEVGALPGVVMRREIDSEGGYEALIEHMAEVTLAGIAAARARIRSRAKPKGNA